MPRAPLGRPVLRFELDDGTLLAQLMERDADELFLRVASERERLATWLPWAEKTTLPATRDFCADSFARAQRGDAFDLGVWHEGRLVGVIGTHSVDAVNASASLGYWLTSEAEGRGIMLRACRRVLDHCFGERGLHRVEIRVAPDNARSLALVRKLGAREEGRAREAARLRGAYQDLLVFGVLAEEWHALAVALRDGARAP